MKAWTSLSDIGRLAVVGGSALALIASSQEGDRAISDGACPTGETCSPETPEGLLFEGAPLGSWPVLTAHTIAAGGRQTFRITDKATGEPFALPFSAKVTSGLHRIVATGTERAVVGAEGVDTGYLRILDGAGRLYDRVDIRSEEIRSMRALPTYAAAHPSIAPSRWAGFAGGRVEVAVSLASADDSWLVDEDIAIRANRALERIGWDSVAVVPLIVGPFELAVDAGHLLDYKVSFPVVETFDDVEVIAPASTGVGGDIAVCFRAWSRGADGPGDDLQVIGVPYQFEVAGPATRLETQRYRACIELHTTGAGTVTVTANAPGRTSTATVAVSGSSGRQRPAMADWIWARTEGERAAAVAAD